MKDVYRVIVVREADELHGVPEVLFEAASQDAGRLLAYVPAEVAAALSAAGYAEVPQRVTGLVDVDALAAATLATEGIVPPSAAPVVVGEQDMPAATNDEPAEAAATDDKPKRKRRTRAEIEADNAAKAAAGAGVPAPAAEAPAGVAVSTTFEGAAPVPPAVAAPAPAEQPAPYNPFA